MPSISQPSPYAEPNTPIASAKRPRTAVRHTGTPHAKHGGALSAQGTNLLQSPPPACQLEKPSPEAGAEEEEKGQQQQQQQWQRAGSEQGDADGSSEGSWKGRVVSLFSPVLKFVGGHQQESEEGQDDEAAAADENDLNTENRGPAGEAGGLQLHKEESEGSGGRGGGGGADAMEVEAPAMEGEGEEEEEQYEGEEEEEEEELEVVEEFNPFLFIKQLPPYEHVRGRCCVWPLPLLAGYLAIDHAPLSLH